jgi:hypothetical protein
VPYFVFSKTLRAFDQSFKSAISRKLCKKSDDLSSSLRAIACKNLWNYFSLLSRAFRVIFLVNAGKGGTRICGNWFLNWTLNV